MRKLYSSLLTVALSAVTTVGVADQAAEDHYHIELHSKTGADDVRINGQRLKVSPGKNVYKVPMHGESVKRYEGGSK